MITLIDIRSRAQALRTIRDRLRRALDRINSIDAEADTQLAELQSDRVFARLPAEHHAKTRADLGRELRQVRKPAASVALYHAWIGARDLAPMLQRYREWCQRTPDAVDSFLAARPGADRQNLSDHFEATLYLVDEARRARFSSELKDAPPSVVAALYAEAVASDNDEAASLVRYVEGRHGRGWSGVTVATDSEVAAAAALRLTIAETRALRVPSELDEIGALIGDTRALIDKASAPELYELRPANPTHDVTSAAYHDRESGAWDAEIAEAARQGQRS